ncbi:hypothetical protein [Heyndrickxia coagulans]|uniref:Uncharacterized protein n=1 Tax=Heyndrickxia coagulans TaxID=1398 RepID=A0A150KGU3_HEYCO|nr:hypothetical protein [Heyndrickxia coagulans]KYC71335.1 hypothetical protein B4099_1232 [Heyndrickxia coagulans]
MKIANLKDFHSIRQKLMAISIVLLVVPMLILGFLRALAKMLYPLKL